MHYYHESCYTFHPVGQGLFASGLLNATVGQSFSWVYDCGTTSSQKLLEREIKQFKKHHNKNKINLVAISHFDKDHISGIPQLLRELTVETMLLPYIPLWQRVLIAFEEEIEADSDEMVFFVNPAEFLNSLDGTIEQVVFVLPSDPEGPPAPNAESPEQGPDSLPETDWASAPDSEGTMLRIPPGDIQPPSDEDMKALNGRSRPGRSVLFLKSGKALTISSYWEFVPYNDQSLAPNEGGAFREEVNRLQNELLSQDPPTSRQTALKAIRKIYDTAFGRSQEKRNLISLFLYGGPRISIVSRSDAFYSYWSNAKWSDLCPISHSHGSCDCRPGILYSGDGYLDKDERLSRLEKYLGKWRMNHIGCFQVMHHGSSSNWHKGVADRIRPNVSLFCSDPKHKRYQHPHAPVLRDFWTYNPLQVDGRSGAIIYVDFSLQQNKRP